MRTVLAAVMMLVTLAASAATLKASQDRGAPIELSYLERGERVQLTLDGDSPDWSSVETLLGEVEEPLRRRWLDRVKTLAGLGSDWSLVLSDGHQQVIELGSEPEVIVEIHERMAEEGARLAEEAERMVAQLERQGVMDFKRFHLDRTETVERMIADGDWTPQQIERLRQALDAHSMK
ncbi:hypothetical protein FCL40_03330 [Ferrimonas sediminicola]|uniref:Uncharacterized protein n=1 Tax=Ferrimonas sediminicola TaxID=2569538 RepID=A0A4V6WMR1_9GAMM|nr:hypothetical protein [Ferrimonas sediminicola]TKB51601.1 hypothetical protein FCL40_03330 [Ferrimonas sediminicola]